MARTAILLAMTAAMLGGCAHSFPAEPRFNRTVLMPPVTAGDGKKTARAASAHTGDSPLQPSPLSCDRFDSAAQPNVADRNACILDLKTYIDDAFEVYRSRVQNGVSQTNFGLDMGALAFGTASTAAGGATAKTVLSAISTTFTATKTTVSDDLLFKSSIGLLLNQMTADRAKKFAEMTASMQLGLDQYSMSQARNDLLAYFAAGTLSNALVSVQSQSGANVARCQANERAARATAQGADTTTQPTTPGDCGTDLSGTYNYDDNSEAIRRLWMPDGKTAGNNEGILINCMKQLHVPGHLSWLINDGTPASRVAVLACAKTAGAK